MTVSRVAAVLLCAGLLVAACSADPAGGPPAPGGERDAGEPALQQDAAAPLDAAIADASTHDAAVPSVDGGERDGSRAMDAGGVSDAGVLDAGGSADGGSDAGADGGPAPPTCPTDTLRLAVAPIGTGALLGDWLVVTWVQPERDAPHPTPQVAYVASFDPAVASIDVPISALSVPTDPVLLCDRACADEDACPCLAEPAIGYARTLVLADANGNGVPDGGDRPVGSLQGVVAYSATRWVPAPASIEMPFPDGVESGVCPMRLLEDSPLDHAGLLTDPAVRFELAVCTDELASCVPPIPRLFP